jgi:antitoxin ParD1/3/4
MHISLTPELENLVKEKVASGLYNNASEVVREALRRMHQYDELLYQVKFEHLKNAVLLGAEQAEQGEFVKQSFSEIVDEAKREKNELV